ncbi:hypothetical protein VPH35_007161 [Triticum aestivum]
MHPGHMRNGSCWSTARLGVWTVVGRAGGQSPGALGTSGGRRRHGRYPCTERHVPRGTALQWPAGSHPTRLETRTKESDMRASRRVLKHGMRKEADEWEALTSRTASRP